MLDSTISWFYTITIGCYDNSPFEEKKKKSTTEARQSPDIPTTFADFSGNVAKKILR